jgi:hypothetical protein
LVFGERVGRYRLSPLDGRHVRGPTLALKPTFLIAEPHKVARCAQVHLTTT